MTKTSAFKVGEQVSIQESQADLEAEALGCAQDQGRKSLSLGLVEFLIEEGLPPSRGRDP